MSFRISTFNKKTKSIRNCSFRIYIFTHKLLKMGPISSRITQTARPDVLVIFFLSLNQKDGKITTQTPTDPADSRASFYYRIQE
jgi:CRISPR/Cas system CMR-associated protein Cmr3 (group 5 of RAMP superfamily)